ncbi:MAG TPA: putative porin [Terriglobales bacterium]|nr:putative porin [Terriglobales bacterium]
MSRFWSGVLLILTLTAAMSAQTATTKASTSKRKKTTSVADELRAMREMMEQQQQQINALQQQIQQRDAAVQQLQQQVQQTQSAAGAAQQTAQSAETASSSSKETLDKLQSDMADVKTTLTNGALQTQEEQKRVSGIEGTLNRFRWNGDVRVRGEFFSDQGNPLCAAGQCVDRWRARVRVRLGLVGKLNEDFVAGLRVATGAITDPTSTNETLTNAFERKNFYLDQGYVTYNPVNHKWLVLTGGKWVYSWNRTPATFDSDLNPEGFSEKLNWEFSHRLLKNFNFQLMQLAFNEVSKGTDSWASGGSVSAKLQPWSRWTVVPTYTLLKWNGENAITANGFGGTAPFAPNGMTNTTFTGGTCPVARCFASGFFYSNFLLNNSFQTWSDRFPLYLNGEFLQNLDAANSELDPAFGAGACHGNICFSPQDKAYGVEIGMGQQKNKGDWQFGYEWRRQEADSAIASFTESDQRAPTNIVQNRWYLFYKLTNNTQLQFTDWIGRTLNSALVGATRANGIVPGEEEPYLNRMQFDVVYTF